ncbi:uncharacterized protein LOC122527947 [Frieseomelitta varia]|uniref:uncharacterized protein LOC122527947 n=1 Tax=Frieseomelitta varia TaxID=561572 RepID=UPI001CB6B1D3|nr:uncharacterized protein LOC122527947 [Frieseomelitta varia]
MARKSILVYDLLKTEQPPEGFTEREIVEQISTKHDIMAGKTLRKQVSVALRRGVDFGIIAKKNNKFRFDPDSAKVSTTRRQTSSRKKARGKSKSRTVKRTTKTQQRSSTKNKNRNQKRPVPQPNLPKSWTPSKRNLADEPLSKVKKI